MTSRTTDQAFAAAASSLVRAVPVGDILSRLVKDCVAVVDADAAAILVLDAEDALTLMASSSAAATQLELLQSLDATGPCADVVRTGEAQSAAGADEMTRRWGHVGSAITEAGFGSVHAYPMRWHGRVFGGLNVFRRGVLDEPHGSDDLAQAFADVATIVLVHEAEIPADEITARVHRATAARSLIEQAKGVLSELEQLDMEAAAARLEEIATQEGLGLTEAAQTVIARTVRRVAPAGEQSQG